MTARDLERFGTTALCDLPRVRSVTGPARTVVVNGVTVLREQSLCAWSADEIALIEYGVEICAASGSGG